MAKEQEPLEIHLRIQQQRTILSEAFITWQSGANQEDAYVQVAKAQEELRRLGAFAISAEDLLLREE